MSYLDLCVQETVVKIIPLLQDGKLCIHIDIQGSMILEVFSPLHCIQLKVKALQIMHIIISHLKQCQGIIYL